jgi:hypothetical protein
LRVCNLSIRERDLAALLNSQVRISSLKFSSRNIRETAAGISGSWRGLGHA